MWIVRIVRILHVVDGRVTRLIVTVAVHATSVHGVHATAILIFTVAETQFLELTDNLTHAHIAEAFNNLRGDYLSIVSPELPECSDI